MMLELEAYFFFFAGWTGLFAVLADLAVDTTFLGVLTLSSFFGSAACGVAFGSSFGTAAMGVFPFFPFGASATGAVASALAAFPLFAGGGGGGGGGGGSRSEEHTSELQSPYVISYAVFC